MVARAAQTALHGPAAAAFGRYLATRIDLVPEALCAQLASIPDVAPPSGPEAVRETFLREVGRPPEWVFAEFDPVPFASRLFWQAHHARVGECEAVVKVVHPELASEIASQDLDHLQRPLAEAGLDRASFLTLLSGFQSLLRSAATLSDDIHAAALLARDARSFDGMVAPRVWPHLCAPGIAVYERCRNLDDPALADPDLCRAVCLAWLRQALHGAVFPAEPLPANIGVARDGRPIFHGGPYAALDEAPRAELLHYLIAVAGGKVDEAAVRLQAAAGMRPDGDAAALLRDIRQMAPFRDGFRDLGPEVRPGGDGFTEEVLIHWRIAARRRCADTLTPFCRGFFIMAATAHALLPGRDVMAEALRDLRLMTAFRDIQELVRPSEAPAMLESFAVTMMRMPEDMDRLLTAFAAGRYPAGDRDDRRPRQDLPAAILCLSVALAAAAFAAHRLAAVHGALQPVAAAIFFGAGLLVLWLVARRT